MAKDWLSCIGNTPLVRLSRLFANDRGITVHAKLEMLNPNGSAKDRPAVRIISAALEQGLIGPGSVIIESSSGNMAISLAAICSRLGMRFISVVDPKTAPQNIRIMRAYGADVELVEQPDPETGEFLPARLNRVKQLVQSIPNSFWPNQYANENNYLSHKDGTMREIIAELGQVDYVIGGVSTCGTMLGCATFVKEQQLDTTIVAVEPWAASFLVERKASASFPALAPASFPHLTKANLRTTPFRSKKPIW
ncbi:pyridoxal-phosphate dependent enzyme [Paenibacillus humicus]|uniref:pyridoxal-phosphate dependent enzyme n=1 Tax=Paenibacillus humicus TaxID=412861 RepID=UPI003D2669CD